MKKFEFVYEGQVVVPSLFALDRNDCKRQLRSMGYQDDPDFLPSKGEIREKPDGGTTTPAFLHQHRPFGLSFIL